MERTHLLHRSASASSSSGSASCSSSPESPGGGQGTTELLAGGAAPPSGEPPRGEAGGRRRSSMGGRRGEEGERDALQERNISCYNLHHVRDRQRTGAEPPASATGRSGEAGSAAGSHPRPFVSVRVGGRESIAKTETQREREVSSQQSEDFLCFNKCLDSHQSFVFQVSPSSRRWQTLGSPARRYNDANLTSKGAIIHYFR